MKSAEKTTRGQVKRLLVPFAFCICIAIGIQSYVRNQHQKEIAQLVDTAKDADTIDYYGYSTSHSTPAVLRKSICFVFGLRDQFGDREKELFGEQIFPQKKISLSSYTKDGELGGTLLRLTFHQSTRDEAPSSIDIYCYGGIELSQVDDALLPACFTIEGINYLVQVENSFYEVLDPAFFADVEERFDPFYRED